MKSHPLAPVFAMALLLAILMWLCSSCEGQIHVYDTDPPTEQGYYLTYIHIEKIVPGDTAYEWRWDVLEFNPNITKMSKWNTLHLDDWNVTVSHWAELPETPNGEKMETTSGSLKMKSIDYVKCKFINIPPDQHKASLRHAEEGLIYWKTKYTPWKHHFQQNPLGAPHSTYRFNAGEAIYFFHEKEFKAEFYCYVGEEDGKEQRVIIDVTKEQWVKDIFNKFYNAKKE